MTPAAASPRLAKLAVICGESSGDALGATLIAAMRRRVENDFELVGVGGEMMEAEGLVSLFDYHVLSIVGASAIAAKLPLLVWRIRQTAEAIIRARPDMLIIIDSPGFTHRVARRVRRALPDIPVVNYVCPTVWAWKPHRARQMVAYVDHILSVLPFEPEVVSRLGGPPVTYVGHSLVRAPGMVAAQAEQERRRLHGNGADAAGPTCLLLPGSRSSELKRLLTPLGAAVEGAADRNPGMRFVLPTLRRHEERVRASVATWPVKPEIVVGTEEKWRAFAAADAAIAASGTVLLELAVAGVPCVSVYKLDPLARLLVWRITAWTAALPNMIADYPVIMEYMNESVRPLALARWLERLSGDTPQRRAMIEGFNLVRARMETERDPGEHAAEVALSVLAGKRAPQA